MTDPSRVREVFTSIARCPNVKACYDGGGGGCARIVRYQITQRGATTYDAFQVPEPWVGQIDVAPILFVSSNPSIGDDDHSRGDTSDDLIWESHHLAFGGGSRPYIDDGRYTMDREGKRIKRVAYWSWTRRRAMELILNRPVVPGTDYAMSEVVHCKSTKEIGVGDAAATCIDEHFEKMMSVAAARVIVAVGGFAQRRIFGGPAPDEPVDMDLGGRRRLVVGLAHPNAFGDGKTLLNRYGELGLENLRRILS